jgi:hypothetical protein
LQNPIASLQALEKYDLAVIAKPTETFTDAETSFRSVYHERRKTLWLIDQVSEMDSLYNPSGATLAYPEI